MFGGGYWKWNLSKNVFLYVSVPTLHVGGFVLLSLTFSWAPGPGKLLSPLSNQDAVLDKKVLLADKPNDLGP